MFLCRAFFLVFLMKYLSKFLSSMKPSLPWKFLATSALRYDTFYKTFHLKWLTVFWILLCLDNGSVICTVTFWYLLDQIHLELCLFRYTQAYSSIFSIIKAYSHILRHIKAYSGIFNTLSNLCILTTLPYSELWHN